MTGAEFVAKDLGMKVETTGPESLGTARKVRPTLTQALCSATTFMALSGSRHALGLAATGSSLRAVDMSSAMPTLRTQ